MTHVRIPTAHPGEKATTVTTEGACFRAWIDKEMAYLSSCLGLYRLESGTQFFFNPTPEFYTALGQGSVKSLNKAMSALADHIKSPSAPVIESWNGSSDPMVPSNYDWASDGEPPGLIHCDGRRRSRVRIGITNKHSPLILGGILAHELTHHYLFDRDARRSDVGDNERLTDLATAYLGLGKLTLNGYEPISWSVMRDGRHVTYTYRVGYLTAPEMALIVDSVCSFRHLPLSAALSHLSPTAARLLSDAHQTNMRYRAAEARREGRRQRRIVRRERLKSLWHRWLGFWQSSDAVQPEPAKGREVPDVVITCGGCYRKLRIPTGRVGRAKCPACKREFLIRPS